jgi:hypothetical protein
MVEPGKVAQLRKAERQGRNDSVKDETLAETLAEQSRLNRAPPQVQQTGSGGVLKR